MKRGTLVRTAAAAAATAVAGAVATDPSSSWYRRLDKPRWQPPGAVFGPVWTALYADIAVTSAVALDGARDERERTALQRALAVNLVLNGAWSWLFWRGRRPWLAAGEAAVLAVSSGDLVRRIARVRPAAGAALAPYAAWCAFATALSTEIARRNPRA